MPEKYREEIEEILERAEKASPSKAKEPEKRPQEAVKAPKRKPAQPQPVNTERHWPSLSASKIAVLGLVLLLVGFWASVLIWVGLGLLVLAYLLFFVQPRSNSYERRWRGQPLEQAPRSPWERLWHWIKS